MPMLSQPSDTESEHDDLGSIRPTLNDVVLALTLPPSALALCVWMPKRRRERILEVTKTITITEIADTLPRILQDGAKHTVTNVELGNGHPVTVHISQTTDQFEESECPEKSKFSEYIDNKPLINCDDEDIVETVHTINEKFIQLPDLTGSSIVKQHDGLADNVIDISFRTSKNQLNKSATSKKSNVSAYFKPSRSLDVLLLSPTDTGFYTSPNRSGLVDGTESDGSMIIHTDDERRLDSGVSSVNGIQIRGNNSLSGGRRRLVPLSSDDDNDDLIYLPSIPTTSATLPRSSRKKKRCGRRYIVTSLTKSQSNPAIYHSYRFPESNRTQQEQKRSAEYNNRTRSHSERYGEQAQENDNTHHRSHLYIQNSAMPSHTYTVTSVTETVREDQTKDDRDKHDLSIHKITVDLELDRVNDTESRINEIIRIENVCENDIIPPNMTSTPLSTLEKARKRSYKINHGVSIVTTDENIQVQVSSSDDYLKAPNVTRGSLSPIVVVNQDRSRKGSTDNLGTFPREVRRKSTVTDIDWFAAFNMKEPITPRSPRSPLPIDVLKESENIILDKHCYNRNVPLSKITVEDIFRCNNSRKQQEHPCYCSACKLSKMSDEELKAILEKKMRATNEQLYVYPEDNTHDDNQRTTTSHTTIEFQNGNNDKATSSVVQDYLNQTAPEQPHQPDPSPLDISMDDVFTEGSEPSTSGNRHAIDLDKYVQRSRDMQAHSGEQGFTTYVQREEKPDVSTRVSTLPEADVSVDDVFNPTPPKRVQPSSDTTVLLKKSQQPTVSTEKRSIEPTYPTIETSTLDISMDAVFTEGSEPSTSGNRHAIDLDKYVQRSRDMQAHSGEQGFTTYVQREEKPDVSTRVSTLPEADVSVDDVFNPTPPKRVQPSSDTTVLLKKSQQPAVSTEHRPIEPTYPTIETSTLDISMDDVFTEGSEPSTSGNRHAIDLDKYVQRSRDMQAHSGEQGFTTYVQREEKPDVSTRVSTLPEADVSVDDVFNPTPPKRVQPSSDTTVLLKKSQQPTVSTEKRSIEPTYPTIETSTLDISMDAVFTEGSEPSTSGNRHAIDLDKYVQRSRDMQAHSGEQGFTTYVQREEKPDVSTRVSTLPEADVSVDDVFNPTPPKRVQPSSDTTVLLKKSQQPAVSTEHRPIEPTYPTIETSTLDISMDDVFTEGSEPSTSGNRHAIDLDKYVQRSRDMQAHSGEQGFTTYIQKEEKPDASTRVSTLPEADVSVDDVFNPTPPKRVQSSSDTTVLLKKSQQPAVSTEHRPIEPTYPTIETSTFDISMDDVFTEGSEPSTSGNRHAIDLDKYVQRSRDMQAHSGEQGFTTYVQREEKPDVSTRVSTLPEADVSVDDVFNPTPPKRVQPSSDTTVLLKKSQQPAVSTEHRPIEPTYPIIETSTLDISMDDVFTEGSEPSTSGNRHAIDLDKYVQRSRDMQAHSGEQGFNTYVQKEEKPDASTRVSTLSEADVSVDDVFNPTPPKRVQPSSDTTVLLKKSQQPAVSTEHPTFEPTYPTAETSTLDISMDDVFTEGSEPSTSGNRHAIDLDKYVQRSRDMQAHSGEQGFTTYIQKEEKPDASTRVSTSPEADVSVDDVFNPTPPKRVQPSSDTTVLLKKFQQPAVSTEHRPIEPTYPTIETSTLDISMDDVFTEGSEPSTSGNRHAIDLDKYVQRSRDMQAHSGEQGFTTYVQREEKPDVSTRVSTLPEADVSVDDVFNPTPPKRVQSSSDTTVLLKKSQQPAVSTEHRPIEPTYPTIETSTLDISMDDVFTEGSEPSTSGNRHAIDLDKYVQRSRDMQAHSGEQGFNTYVQKEEKPDASTRVSTLSEADVSVDDVFNPTPPKRVQPSSDTTVLLKKSQQPAVSTEHRPIEPTYPIIETSTLDISMDDVFTEGSEPSTSGNRHAIDLDKYVQRSRDMQAHSGEQGFTTYVQREEKPDVSTRVSTLPEADVSVDDVFNPTTPKRVQSSSDTTVLLKKSQQPAVSPEHRPIEPTYPTIETSTLDISMDDVFTEGSEPSTSGNRHAIDLDKYVQRSRDMQAHSGEQGFNTYVQKEEKPDASTRVSTLSEADVSVDDVFNPTPPKRVQPSSDTTVLLKKSQQPAVSTEHPTFEPTYPTAETSTLDISMDDVFTEGSEPSTSGNRHAIDLDKYVQRSRDMQAHSGEQGFTTYVQREEKPDVSTRVSTLPEADVSVDDVFNPTPPKRVQPSSDTTVLLKKSQQPAVSTEHRPIEPTYPTIETSTLDISMDDVFTEGSEPSTSGNRHAIDLDKYVQRSRDMQAHSGEQGFNTYVQKEEKPDASTRVSTLSEADVSVDDVFNPTPPKRVQPSSDTTVLLKKSQQPAVSTEHPTFEPTYPTAETSTLDISMDDVFTEGSEPSTSGNRHAIDLDKYVQRSRDMQAHSGEQGFTTYVQKEEKPDASTRVSTLPEADVSVDDVFNPTPPKRVQSSSDTTVLLKKSQQPAVSTEHRPIEPTYPTIETSTLDISMDDVFTEGSEPSTPGNRHAIDLDKYVQRSRDMQAHSGEQGFTTYVQREEKPDVSTRVSTLPEADVSVDDVFNPTPQKRVQPYSDTTVLRKKSQQPTVSTEKRSIEPTYPTIETSTLDISMDDVFTEGSEPSTSENRHAIDLDKYVQRSRDMQAHSGEQGFTTYVQREEKPDASTRVSTLPEADVSVDDVFNPTPPKRVQPSSDTTVLLKKSQQPAVSTEHRPIEPTYPIIETSTLDISMDDVFTEGSEPSTSGNRHAIDLDKYVQRSRDMQAHSGEQGFTTYVQREEKPDASTRVSTLPEADVSVDDVFNPTPPKRVQPSSDTTVLLKKSQQPAVSTEHRPIEPTYPTAETSTLDISMDDVFTEGSEPSTSGNRHAIDLDKYVQRSRDMQAHSGEQGFTTYVQREEKPDVSTRVSTLPEADVSVDDVFNPTPPKTVQPSSDTTVLLKKSQQPAVSTEHRPIEPTYPIIETSTLDISMDDVFTEGSEPSTSGNRHAIDLDKYVQRSRDMQAHSGEQGFTTYVQREEKPDVSTRVSTLPEADVSVDDVFNPTPPKRVQPSSDTTVLLKKSQQPTVSTEKRSIEPTYPTIETSTLDISMDAVFTEGSEPSTSGNRHAIDLDKFVQRSRDMQAHSGEQGFTTYVQREEKPDASTRVSTLPEADVSVDDVFNPTPPKRVQSSSDTTVLLKKSQQPAVSTEHRPIEPTYLTIKTSTLDISMDDVFTEGSEPSTSGNRHAIDLDKYVQRSRDMQAHSGEQGFTTYVQKEEKPDASTRVSTLPEADVSVDDVFNPTPQKRVQPCSDTTVPWKKSQQPAVSTEHRPIEPTYPTAETSTLDISMDDVFTEGSEPSTSGNRHAIDLNKYVQRSRDMQAHSGEQGFTTYVQREEKPDVSTRVSTLPEADVSVDDVFNPTPPKRVPPSSDTTVLLKKSQQPAVSTEHRPIEPTYPTAETSTLDISMDDLFTEGSEPSTSGNRHAIDLDKYVQRSRDMQAHSGEQGFTTYVQKEEKPDASTRVSTLPETDVSVDDVFNPTPPKRVQSSSDTTVLLKKSQQPAVSTEHRPIEPTYPTAETSTLDISMDDVFTEGSEPSTSGNRHAIDLDKYVQRSRDMQAHSGEQGFTSYVQREEKPDVSTRVSTLPEADVSVDDVFNPTPPKRVQPSSDTTVLLKKSQQPAVSTQHPTFEPTYPTAETSTLDISMDDVFTEGSEPSTSGNRHAIDLDKYVQRSRDMQAHSGEQGFTTYVQREEKPDVSTRVSTLPEADVSVDDVFNPTPPKRVQPSSDTTVLLKKSQQPAVSTQHPTFEPTYPTAETSTLDISMDDVFTEGSEPSTSGNRHAIDLDKYVQRSRDMQAHSGEQGFTTYVQREEKPDVSTRVSTLPEADVSVDDVFNPTPPKRVQPSSDTTVLLKKSQQPAVSTEHPTFEPTYPTAETSTLDISMDDVFTEGSEPSTSENRHAIDLDKYVQRSRDMQAHSGERGFTTYVQREEKPDVSTRVSTLPEADVSVDDVFNPTPPKRVQPSSETIVFSKEPTEIVVDDIFSPIAPQALDVTSDSFGFDVVDKTEMKKLSLPTPPNSPIGSPKNISFELSTVRDNTTDASVGSLSDKNDFVLLSDENSENRLRSRSVTSLNRKKVFTVTFSSESSDHSPAGIENTDHERPEATRKIRKPPPPVDRTSLFDVFHLNSENQTVRPSASSGHMLNTPSIHSVEEKLYLDDSLESYNSLQTTPHIMSYEYQPIITEIHATSLTVSLDELNENLKKTDRIIKDSHVIPSTAYEEVKNGNGYNSRRASRYSIRTDELDVDDIMPIPPPRKQTPFSTNFSDYYNDLKSPPRTPLKIKRRSIDFFYEEPFEMPIEEEVDVEDFVDEILNQSLDEAAFYASSKHLPSRNKALRSTDTSIDRKQSETTNSETVNYEIGTSSDPPSYEQSQKDEHLFISSANRDSLYEAVLAYPNSDIITIKDSRQTFIEPSEEVDYSSEGKPHTYISEATVVMKESTPPDSYYVRLVFPENQKDEKQISITQQTSDIISTETTESYQFNERNSEVKTNDIKHFVEKMIPQQKDDEFLEIESNSEYFIIHGKYSMIIHKTEPLGEMLSKIQTSSLDFTVTPKLRRILRQCLQNKISGNTGTDISSRALHMLDRPDPAYEVYYEMASNRYSPTNIMGNINFCTAEIMICKPLLRDRLSKSMNIVEDHMFHYGPGGGYDEVKDVFLQYLKKFMNASHVLRQNLTFVGSGNTAYDLISHCIFEADDVLLINTPTYARVFVNCEERASCRVEPVPMDLSKLEIDISSFEKVLTEQSEKGSNVRGVVLINPSNPLGITFPKQQVLELGNWAARHDLTLIVDESFSGSNHGSRECESFLSYQHELNNPSKAAWFWSLSKDFGLPGVKISVIHTPNQYLKEALSTLGLIFPVSSLAEDFASNLLSDFDFVSNFHETKNQRIHSHYKFVIRNLEALNLNYITATSGFFVLVDFRQKLNAPTFEEETKLWHKLISHGLYLTRGKDMRCSEPGWMRLVFGCDKEQVEEGIRRLHSVFGSTTSVLGSIEY